MACQGRKLAGDGAVRGRVRAIRGGRPTFFRYCSAHGMPKRPVGPATRLQVCEFLRLLRRRDSVCRFVIAFLEGGAGGCAVSSVGVDWGVAAMVIRLRTRHCTGFALAYDPGESAHSWPHKVGDWDLAHVCSPGRRGRWSFAGPAYQESTSKVTSAFPFSFTPHEP